MNKDTINLYLGNDIIENLHKKAKEEDRSVSYLARQALKPVYGGGAEDKS